MKGKTTVGSLRCKCSFMVVYLQATFKGWLDIMNHAIDSRDVSISQLLMLCVLLLQVLRQTFIEVYIHIADATQLSSCVVSASAV